MIENKKVFILGMAKSGFAIAKLLSSKNEIVISDVKDVDSSNIQELKALGVNFIKTNEPESILDDSFDILIKNPGVFPYHPCVDKARKLNIPVVNEMEVSYHYITKPVKIIGVTGSNGKTTTTTLIYEILKKAGINVKLAGNIGMPLASVVTSLEANDILLLEISDHQLIDMYDFKTDISIMTNICPTHLDYHGSYDNYKKTKKRIFNNHSANDIAIINKDNYDSLDVTSEISSTKYYFNDNENYIRDGIIYVDSEPVINTKDIILKGKHNYENILCALVLLKILKIDYTYACDVLKTFSGVEHRIEFVRDLRGVSYYNDSKSTNPIATVTALKSFEGNIHLILGGMNRNQEFKDLIPFISKIKKVYAIGEVRDKISDFCKSNNIPCAEFEFLKDAMINLNKNTVSGDIVLLSPASASWDQYDKFEERGNEFKDIVNNLN